MPKRPLQPRSTTLPSLYAQYAQELEGLHVHETRRGFATYRYCNGGECYIRDIFVHPKFRKSGEASRLADAIAAGARDKGCTILTGSVCPNTQDPTSRIRVLLGYGMRFHSVDKNTGLMYFMKEIK